jgi:hypothetical protein
VWGISIGGVVLQTALEKRLPTEVLKFVPNSASGALQYAVIPLIKTMPDALQADIRKAFGDSLVYVWIAATAFSGLGLISSLPMRLLPLHTDIDKKWTYQAPRNGSVEEAEKDTVLAEVE